ncbi:MAG TPA: glycosyltransferase [Candidatus Binataceae bacterium]|nr:glycosyltransferase [Candidatus Binataceae bacterium]
MPAKITTIIPTFNRPRLLERAIRSVLAQNYSDFQVCVYDNASGDETAAVVARLSREDPRVSYHCHARNIGAWNNFKYGVEQVRTPYFNFLSDDDVLLPEFFETAVNALESRPQAGLFAGATVRFCPGFISTPVLQWPARLFNPPHGFLEILRRDFPDWNAIIFRHSALGQVGQIDTSFEHAIDLDFICRYAVSCGMIVCPVPYAILTLGHDHLSKQLYSPATHARHWLRILDRYQLAPWIDDEAREVFAGARAWIGRKVFKNAVDAAASSHSTQALEAAACLKESFAMPTAPFLLKLMTADSAWGEAMRSAYRLLRSSERAVRAPLRQYLHKQDIRSVAAALAL